jgi:hypothetical protein
MKTCILVLLLLGSKAFSQEASNFGTGGTYLTHSSLLNSVINAPTNLYQNTFVFELNLSLAASESLMNLSKENSHVDPGTYDQRFSPYYGKANIADGQAGIGLGYKGFTLFPKVYIAHGEALLNNPVYPEAAASINVSQGYAIGYGTKFENYLFGASYLNLQTKDQVSSARVLDYENGTITNINESKDEIYNFSLGYDKNNYKVISNYQHNGLYSRPDRYAIGYQLSLSHIDLFFDMQDLQNNNLENESHIGITYNLGYLKFSAGLNQLYPTYGIGFDSPYFKLFLSYGGRNQFEQFRQEYKSYELSLILSNF